MVNHCSCVILGAGNVASAFAPALHAAGVKIEQIYSRTEAHSRALANAIDGAQSINSLDQVKRNADLYFVALSDNAVAATAEALAGTGGLWLHTSGAVPASALSPASDRFGVLYPLQTFTRGVDVELKNVPLFIEASTPPVLNEIKELAYKLSTHVSEADSAQRLRLHAAAVFACNFANRLWSYADDILRRGGEDITALKPLLEETLRKAMTVTPAQAQTGPARRGDTATMQRHHTVLTPHEQRLYDILSADITAAYSH